MLPEKVCHPGVPRGAVASGYLCRAADPTNTEGNCFPVAGKCDEQKEKAICITDSMDMNLSKLWETVRAEEPGVLQSTGLQRVGHDLMTG